MHLLKSCFLLLLLAGHAYSLQAQSQAARPNIRGIVSEDNSPDTIRDKDFDYDLRAANALIDKLAVARDR